MNFMKRESICGNIRALAAKTMVTFSRHIDFLVGHNRSLGHGHEAEDHNRALAIFNDVVIDLLGAAQEVTRKLKNTGSYSNFNNNFSS